jgi:hypothetical protein
MRFLRSELLDGCDSALVGSITKRLRCISGVCFRVDPPIDRVFATSFRRILSGRPGSNRRHSAWEDNCPFKSKPGSSGTSFWRLRILAFQSFLCEETNGAQMEHTKLPFILRVHTLSTIPVIPHGFNRAVPSMAED